jgi:hypothetical protein
VHFIGEASGDARPSKRMKIDHEEQVTQLFQGKVKNEVFDQAVKKFTFKLVNDNKDK